MKNYATIETTSRAKIVRAILVVGAIGALSAPVTARAGTTTAQGRPQPSGPVSVMSTRSAWSSSNITPKTNEVYSGYMIQGENNYTAAEAIFTVPKTDCRNVPALAGGFSIWVGLGAVDNTKGHTNAALLPQAGVLVDCLWGLNAFYEIEAQDHKATSIDQRDFPVQFGDTLEVEVWKAAGSQTAYNFLFTNLTRGGSYPITEQVQDQYKDRTPLDAEWIVERFTTEMLGQHVGHG